MNMPEERLREQLASSVPADLPRPGVDLAAARRAGRRRLRRRRLGLSAGVIASATSVAAMIVFTATASPWSGVLRPRASGPAAPRRPLQALRHAPRRFDILVPYAAFGTLPTRFSAKYPYQSSDAQSVQLTASTRSGAASLNLDVYAAGACKLLDTAPPRPEVGLGRPSPRRGCALGPPLAAAPRVHGARAYWVKGGIVWEYAADAWAYLNGDMGFFSPPGGFSSAVRTRAELKRIKQRIDARLSAPGAGLQGRELLNVAEHVRYAQTTAVRFPFRVTALPPGWRATSVSYQISGNLLTANGMTIGPAGHPARSVSIITIPVSAEARWCGKYIPGQSQDVAIGGVHGVLRIIDNPLKKYEDFCVGNDRGMSFDLTEGTLRPLTGIVAHLRSLGPDPRRWTANPLP